MEFVNCENWNSFDETNFFNRFCSWIFPLLPYLEKISCFFTALESFFFFKFCLYFFLSESHYFVWLENFLSTFISNLWRKFLSQQKIVRFLDSSNQSAEFWRILKVQKLFIWRLFSEFDPFKAGSWILVQYLFFTF